MLCQGFGKQLPHPVGEHRAGGSAQKILAMQRLENRRLRAVGSAADWWRPADCHGYRAVPALPSISKTPSGKKPGSHPSGKHSACSPAPPFYRFIHIRRQRWDSFAAIRGRPCDRPLPNPPSRGRVSEWHPARIDPSAYETFDTGHGGCHDKHVACAGHLCRGL